MPDKNTIERAQRAEREGKSASSQAGEFVREEMHHIREGKHGASSARQAIAIGLSQARRAGVRLPLPREGTVSDKTRRSAQSATKAGRLNRMPSRKRALASLGALKRVGQSAASNAALSRHAKSAARQRGPAARSVAAHQAARTRSRSPT